MFEQQNFKKRNQIRLQIPGKSSLFKENIPISVELPLQAHTSKLKNIFYMFLILLFVIAFFSVAFAMILLGYNVQFFWKIVCFILCVLSLGFALICLRLGFTCLLDALRTDPVLLIDIEGFSDRRTGISAKWSEVREAQVLPFIHRSSTPFRGSLIVSLALQMKRNISLKQSRFRIGVFWIDRFSMPDLTIPVALLDINSHILGYTMLQLIQQDGGEVIIHESYPKLIKK